MPACLDELRDYYKLALVTNGASCLQREKLFTAGLDDYFEVVVISGEFGVSKPAPSIFEHTLSLLGSDHEHAVMVGDSLARDVDGAIAAGLGRSGSIALVAHLQRIAPAWSKSPLSATCQGRSSSCPAKTNAVTYAHVGGRS